MTSPAPTPLGYCAPCLIGGRETPAVTIYDRTSVCRDCLVGMHEYGRQSDAQLRVRPQAFDQPQS